jgi:hypothetical protein
MAKACVSRKIRRAIRPRRWKPLCLPEAYNGYAPGWLMVHRARKRLLRIKIEAKAIHTPRSSFSIVLKTGEGPIGPSDLAIDLHPRSFGRFTVLVGRIRDAQYLFRATFEYA